MSNRALKKTASSKAAPQGAAIARVVPVLPLPNRANGTGMLGEALKTNDSMWAIIVDSHKNALRMFKAFRRDLYARTDSMIGNLVDAQQRHSELSGMLELSALLEKSESPKGSPNSGSSLGRVNGHVLEIIEHDRQYVEQVIKSF